MNIPDHSPEPGHPPPARPAPSFAAVLQVGGEGVSAPEAAGNRNRSTHRNKLSAKSSPVFHGSLPLVDGKPVPVGFPEPDGPPTMHVMSLPAAFPFDTRTVIASHSDNMGGPFVTGQAPAAPRKKPGRKPKVHRTAEEKAHLSAVGKARWAAKQKAALDAALVNPLKRPDPAPAPPLPGSLLSGFGGMNMSPTPEIDYDKLAEAMLRAQRKEEERGEKLHRAFQHGGPDAVEELRAKLDTDLVVPTNNPVTRILSQLSYPKDKEGQVVAMIAANMAPSVNPGDPEGELQAALQERAVLAHMKEYVMGLRPELPKTRLEPKYVLNHAGATG